MLRSMFCAVLVVGLLGCASADDGAFDPEGSDPATLDDAPSPTVAPTSPPPASAPSSTAVVATAVPAEVAEDPSPPAAAATPTVVVVPPPTVEPEPEEDCVRLSGFATDGENALWRVVNDGVMGGLSSGGPTFENSSMRFAGEINTNGGGFSSVRLDLLPGVLDGYDWVVVRARTDGRTNNVIIDDTHDGRDRRISHQADLVFGPVDQAGWQEATASFADLKASLFGRAVDVAPFRNDLAIEMGIMISDGIDGPFQIDIDSIHTCR